MLTVGSLFSGIGGLELGLEWTGHFTTRWQVENDPYAVRVLTKHWPEVTRYGDITTLDWRTVEPVDCICGGFPCQPVSLAGRRRAQQDARWLWPAFANAIRVLRPRYVLVENTPGLLSAGMGAVLGDLAASGYDAEWQSLPAAAFGAPHIRERVFIVAYPASPRCDGGTKHPQYVFRQSPLSARSRDRGEMVAYSTDQGPMWGNGGVRADEGPREVRSHHRSGALTNDGWKWWAVEPDVGRVADGVSARVERLRGLGNAVVPPVAQWIGEQLWRFHTAIE